MPLDAWSGPGSKSLLFRQVFTEELTKNGGYTMATSAGEQVLSIKPAIVDLDVAAPDTDTAGYRLQFAERWLRRWAVVLRQKLDKASGHPAGV